MNRASTARHGCNCRAGTVPAQFDFQCKHKPCYFSTTHAAHSLIRDRRSLIGDSNGTTLLL